MSRNKRIKKAKPTLKSNIDEVKNLTPVKTKQYHKMKNWRFARNFITTIAVFAVSAFVAIGTTACDVTEKPNPGPVDPNPPIVTPDPDEPENPDKPDKPDPDKPDPDEPENPDKPDPDEPGPDEPDPDEPIDYDKLTPETLTQKQRITIINNVTTALKENIQKEIGRKGYVNKVIGIDFEDNYIKLLLDYNGVSGDVYGFYKYAMTTEMNYKNLLTTQIAPANPNMAGERIIHFSHKSSDDRVAEVIAKLNPSIDVTKYDFVSLVDAGGAIIPGIGDTHKYSIYSIDNNQITKTDVNAKSDGNYVDPIDMGIINGEEGKTYTTPTVEIIEFGPNALYNFDGLEKESLNKNKTYKVMVGNETIGIIRNGKYYCEEQE